jgi:hypothetical protein
MKRCATSPADSRCRAGEAVNVAWCYWPVAMGDGGGLDVIPAPPLFLTPDPRNFKVHRRRTV